MKLVWIAVLVAGPAAFGQQRPNPTGFGSVLYPGTGGPPPPSAHGGNGSVLYPGTGGPPGNNLLTGRRYTGVPPQTAHPSHQRNVIVPVPVYYGGYYYSDPSGGYAQQQPAPAYDDPSMYAAPSQAPVVVINQAVPREPPPFQLYHAPGPGDQATNVQPDAPPTIYLIAMTDHTILPAIAYWVDADTLSYITPEGDQNRVSLALVDREFSKKLNDDRHIEFKLPK